MTVTLMLALVQLCVILVVQLTRHNILTHISRNMLIGLIGLNRVGIDKRGQAGDGASLVSDCF